MERSPMTRPASFSMGAMPMRPGTGMRQANTRSSHERAPRPVTSTLP